MWNLCICKILFSAGLFFEIIRMQSVLLNHWIGIGKNNLLQEIRWNSILFFHIYFMHPYNASIDVITPFNSERKKRKKETDQSNLLTRISIGI